MVEFFRKYFETKEAEKEARVHLQDEHEEDQIEGRIIKVSDRGYCFLISKDIPFTRIFLHWTALKSDTLHFTELRKGMIIRFTPQETKNHGFRAIKAEVVKDQ